MFHTRRTLQVNLFLQWVSRQTLRMFFPSEHVNSNQAHIHIHSKNARLHSDEKLAELLGEMQHCKWDLVVFSKTKANIDKTVLQGGHVLYGSRTPTTYAGVAIAIHSRFSSCAQRVHVLGDRLMCVDLKIGMRIMRVVSLYMPHAGYPIEGLRQLYEQFRFILADARRRGFSYVVAGDFNSQLDIGVRGELLDQFCQACNLLLLNRNAPVHESYAFESSLGVRRRIDLLLCHVSLSVHAAAASHEFDMGSDQER